MGAWGYGPRDNDAAADWLGDIGDYCSEQVAQVFAQDFNKVKYEEVRAACLLLERLGQTYIWPARRLDAQLNQGIALLNKLLDDEEWTASWKEPEQVRDALQEQIAALEQRLNPTRPDRGD